MTMAMPIKVMVTPITRTSMPKAATTTIKHMAMVTTTRGRRNHQGVHCGLEKLTKYAVMATTAMATVPMALTPPTAQHTVKDTPMEDTTRLDTRITATSITTRATENTHEADVVMIPRRTPKLSAISQ